MVNRRFIVSAVLAGSAFAAVVSARAADVPSPAPPAPFLAQGPEEGERLMNASCQACHDVRRIQTQAKDAEGWTQTVNTMVEKGAMISKEDIPVLVKYLVTNHGPLPEGPGKQIVLNICTMCHDLGRIKLGRRSAEEWEETLVSMLNEGAPLSDQDFPIVHQYLSANFGVD